MIDLFLLPFAGGSKYSYNALKKHLPAEINFRPLEFPGRGGRLKEPLLYRMEQLVDDLAGSLGDGRRPYALFGHSMGAIVGYLLLHRQLLAKAMMPVCFFASGNDGPSRCPNGQRIHLVPEGEFAEAMNAYGGLPPGLLEDASLMRFFQPILRADFEIYETYVHKKRPKLPCPVTLLWGTDDNTCSKEGLASWQDETEQRINSIEVAGDHFFISKHPALVSRIIYDELFPARAGVTNK